MSIHIQTALGLIEIGGEVTKDKILSALGYTPVSPGQLPNIIEDEAGVLRVADEAGHIIAQLSSAGFDTTEILLNGEKLGTRALAHIKNNDIHVTARQKEEWSNKSNFSGRYDDLTGKPEIMDDGGDKFQITDCQGNIALQVDEKGARAVDFIAVQGSKETSVLEHVTDNERHVTATDRKNWSVPRFSGKFGDLIDAPFIEDESGTLDIADLNGNKIMSVHEGGITTTNITAKKLYLDGNEFDGSYSSLKGKPTNFVTETQLKAHVDNDARHLTQEDINKWNSKSDFDGNYGSLQGAPDITDNVDTDSLKIVDKSGNIIALIDKDGLTTTKAYLQALFVNGYNILDWLNALSDVQLGGLRVPKPVCNIVTNILYFSIEGYDPNARYIYDIKAEKDGQTWYASATSDKADSTAAFNLTSLLSTTGDYSLTIRAKAIGYLLSEAVTISYKRQ